MFRDKFQGGLFPILSATGRDPLRLWGTCGNGLFRRVYDDDVDNMVVEVKSNSHLTTYLSLPKEPGAVLGIKLPYLTVVLKNMGESFFFVLEIRDSAGMKRRIQVSNSRSKCSVSPTVCHVPLRMHSGLNKVQMDLGSLTGHAFNTHFLEVRRVQFHANCRLRYVYFSDRPYSEDEMPQRYRVEGLGQRYRSQFYHEFQRAEKERPFCE